MDSEKQAPEEVIKVNVSRFILLQMVDKCFTYFLTGTLLEIVFLFWHLIWF